MQRSAGFMDPYWNTMKYFTALEAQKSSGGSPLEAANELMELLMFDMQIAARGAMSGVSAMSRYHSREMIQAGSAMLNLMLNGKAEDLVGYSEKQLKVLDMVVSAYPRAIRDIRPEYGFHFDNGGYTKVAETERFELYQVLPINGAEVRRDGKPILILPPFVLGANILAFLPGENRSYVHAFANQGIPTYIRILKDIDTNEAVQLMKGEDDALDTRYFSELLVSRHGKQVTLNGYCQGGFLAVIDLLSGQLDGLVDSLITCVAPIDGSRSDSLVEYINHLPERYRDLGYAVKTLPNGNGVVDGKVMSWVFKLKSMERESPVSSFYRDLLTFSNGNGSGPKIGKVAAAIGHWLTYDRKDLPLEITRLSFDSYTHPITEDGTLPVKLFGRPLNLGRIREKGIKWLICIAEDDELTEQGATLAPLKFVDAEVTLYPKGHASIATSWPQPDSQCALATTCNVNLFRFPGKGRGPVRFHLDQDESAEQLS